MSSTWTLWHERYVKLSALQSLQFDIDFVFFYIWKILRLNVDKTVKNLKASDRRPLRD